jgi:predicted DNA-binding WGR domain protein
LLSHSDNDPLQGNDISPSVAHQHLPTAMISLERHNPTRRMHRYYRLRVERNLFGEWSLVREWGRIGQPSRRMIDLHATAQGAQAAMSARGRRNAAAGIATCQGSGHNHAKMHVKAEFLVSS